MQETFHKTYTECFTDDVVNIINEDILYKMDEKLSGMSWYDPWTYMGGFGLAGFHFEDGWLHFGHHLIDYRFIYGSDTNKMDIKMLEMWRKLSRKTWVVSKVGGIEGVKLCNRFLADAMGFLDVGDAILTSRMFMLDPRAFKDSDIFTVIHQNPGDFMFGDLGHSVSGFGLLSFAWNLVFKESIPDYIQAERDMAGIIRNQSSQYKKQRAEFNNGVEPDLRSFTFMGTMLDYVIASKPTDVIPEVLQAVKGCYGVEKEKCIKIRADFMAHDAEYAPINKNDAQCTECGISCLFAMYVAKATQQRQLPRDIVCCECAIKYGGTFQAVSLVPTFMATKHQLM